MLFQALKYVCISLVPFLAAGVTMVQKGLLDSSIALFLLYATSVGVLLVVLMLLERTTAIETFVDGVFKDARLKLPNTTNLSAIEKLEAVLEHTQKEAMQQQNTLYQWQDLFEYLPDALLILDGSTKIIAANSMARKIFGQNLQGKPLAALLRQPQALRAVDAALLDGLQHNLDITLSLPQERHYELIIATLPEQHAAPIKLLLALQDQSSSKQAQRAHTDFVSYASHELRTPLTALLGFIETLQGAAKDDPHARQQFLGIMHEQASRMSRLINDLLSLSRLEQNHALFAEDYLHLAPLLHSSIDALRVKAEQKGMAIALLETGDAFTLNGAADELTQLFQNLLDNAIKYGAENSVIDVKTMRIDVAAKEQHDILMEREENFVLIDITNQGEGISQEDLPRLTERFFRTRTAQAKSDSGTGLGLSIVKHIVAHHQGIMAIESELGSFTKVRVYLPLAG